MSADLVFHDDRTFDELLPSYVRERSRRFWTPIEVAVRAAALLAEHGARKVLDVGAGPGKFCLVAGRSQPLLEFHGVEQRAWLVDIARSLAERLALGNVRFSSGDATDVPFRHYDGFYFFNPFTENAFDRNDRFAADVPHSRRRLGTELLHVHTLLGELEPGAVFVTYHGLGGPIPSSYDLVSDERAGTDRLRVWTKRARKAADWAWLETPRRVARVQQTRVRSALASLICESDER